ncbi:hypothetical protein F5B22DRAFT_641374 [Xylaria bambusicola]|uniref:uncharacterized protein n=1 Tax=Xylaria bambusicola TaxID=326684 RepID=UPI002007EB09|nr:uncharacterized protein F5B22DRAFT_641374 [Xylaria bambusicola]KAI0526225.1 hypothetical protein F5B22DRAFT_641374 [Xylaria bambusicola]
MSSSVHETFKALGPVDWEAFAQEDPTTCMPATFNDAHCLIDSIPAPSESDSLPSQSAEYSQKARELRKEWKAVKVNPRDNPLELNVYKLPAKDGRGAWFARRSVHSGQSYKKWKTGIEKEFAESLKVQGQPGDGKIRGLGADKCVADRTVNGYGKIQVYQLSAQFPGPTTPRDFVTLCLISDTETTTFTAKKPDRPREYMLVSKPCVHPECPERQGFIRGYYESVELIREVKTLESVTPSSSSGPSDPLSSSATSRSENIGRESTLYDQSAESNSSIGETYDDNNSTIEWIMITRSDPGGSVPRFLIEKKTPEGIVTDAGKFVQWISSERFEMLLKTNFESIPTEVGTTPSNASMSVVPGGLSSSVQAPHTDSGVKTGFGGTGSENSEPALSPGPSGVYGMISSTLGMVASAAASRFYGQPEESESEISTPEISDTSSLHSFHSFDDTVDIEPITKIPERDEPAISVNADADESSLKSTQSTHHDKELRKLEERRRKAEEKLRRAEERALAKKNNDAQRDELALQKLRDRHEREIAKQEDKYQRERRKLEAKRAAEEKKAEERRRKQIEREDKANLTLELEKTRADRDVARKEIEILKEQVGQLQALNTKLVARLGREGISLDDSFIPSSGSCGPTPASLGGPVTEQDLEKRPSSVKS